MEKNTHKRIGKIEEKHYTLAEQTLDIALKGNVKDKESFKMKLDGTKLGMAIVNNFNTNKRVEKALELRERMANEKAKMFTVRTELQAKRLETKKLRKL